jgi:hypothetical protein
MSETKQIQIKGDAVAAYTKERKTRKRHGQKGGYDVPSPAGAIPLTQANLGRATNFVRKMNGGSKEPPNATLGGAQANVSANEPSTLATQPAATKEPAMLGGGGALTQLAASSTTINKAPPAQAGGKAKLILEPKKKSMKKLHLAPASVSGSHKRSVSKTRKIRVNLHGMKRRLTRAKEIHKDSRHKDISHIKKTLIDAKLIKPREEGKPDSTEYDMMLRKTYENYMLLRNRAL